MALPKKPDYDKGTRMALIALDLQRGLQLRSIEIAERFGIDRITAWRDLRRLAWRLPIENENGVWRWSRN